MRLNDVLTCLHLLCIIVGSVLCSYDPWGVLSGRRPMVSDYSAQETSIVPRHQQLVPSFSSRVAELCTDPRCSCTTAPTASTNVSCRCSPQDKEATLSVNPLSVPREASSVLVEGCRNVVFLGGGLQHLKKLTSLSVSDVGEVVFESGSFYQPQAEQGTVVEVGRCRQLVIKSGAFASHPLKPVAFHSSQCHVVRIEESAFNRLQLLTLDHIQRLELASHAFRFASAGVELTDVRADITIRHAVMTDLKNFTFPSPLNQLHLENVTVLGQIQSNAMSALRIVQLRIDGSRIGTIASTAFSALTHLDSLELRSSQVDVVEEEAVASAASSLTIEDCQIGLMNRGALSMPAARVTLRGNTITVLASAALHLREWNELLVENNTILSVERHAFYNIGEPKTVHVGDSELRFVIRHNVFHKVESGSFVISAQALKFQLEGNQFLQLCDCQMTAWTADLTQVNRRTETTVPLSSLDATAGWKDQREAPGALWLGSSLFNTSSCWIDQAAADCLSLSASSFFSMDGYTKQVCSPGEQQQKLSHCITIKRSSHDGDQPNKDTFGTGDGGSGIIRTVGFIRSQQDMLMVVILAVLAALILLGVFIGLMFARRHQTKTRHQSGNAGNKMLDDRTTSSPLLPDSEKQLGSGVISSGSISRLSVKEYRSYLEELGPIYSEPLDSPLDGPKRLPPAPPPDIPAIPIEWIPKTQTKAKNDSEKGKSTIDRGTQTFIELVEENTPAYSSSLAHEFTQDVLSALSDKLEISPMYSEVKDSIKPEGKLTTSEPLRDAIKSASLAGGDLYDLIRVVDSSQPRPSTSSAGSEHIYCKPWRKDSDPLKSPLLTSDPEKSKLLPGGLAGLANGRNQPKDSEPTNEIQVPQNGAYAQVHRSATSKSPPVAAKLQNDPAEKKRQPFYIRGSLPKWPPPSKEVGTPARNGRPGTNGNGPPKSHSMRSAVGTRSSVSPPVSPTKQLKPARRSNSATKSPKTVTSSPTSPSKATPSLHDTTDVNPSLTSLTNSQEAGECDAPREVISAMPTTEPATVEAPTDEYSEVTSVPFSFSFRKPLFDCKESPISVPGSSAVSPPKVTTGMPSPILCEYADPRDQRDANEPLYSELLLHEESTTSNP